MPADLNIEVTVEAPGGVPASVVVDVLDAVNRALRREAERELEGLRFAGMITPAHFEAAATRLRATQPNALILRDARTGSVILGGAVAGLAIWLLNQTLGESLTEAWKKSDSHRKIVEWLTRHWSRDSTSAANAIRREFKEGPPSLAERHTYSVTVQDQVGGMPTIQVQVIVRPGDDYAVPRGDLPRPSNEGPAADLEAIVRIRKATETRREYPSVGEGDQPSREA
jgi:hypothetical protein